MWVINGMYKVIHFDYYGQTWRESEALTEAEADEWVERIKSLLIDMELEDQIINIQKVKVKNQFWRQDVFTVPK